MIHYVVFTSKIFSCTTNPSEVRQPLVCNLIFSLISCDDLYRFATTSEDIQTFSVANHERTAVRK